MSHRLSETACDVQTNAKKRSAALEEVRAAVEELVLAGGHAAELLPRSPDVMQAQAGPVLAHMLKMAVRASQSTSTEYPSLNRVPWLSQLSAQCSGGVLRGRILCCCHDGGRT